VFVDVERGQSANGRDGVAVDLVRARPDVRLATPRLRVHPAKPKVGLRTTKPDEMWHIDTTIIRLLDGTPTYVHAVIDNFSRRISAWRVADTSAAVNSVTVLVEAIAGDARDRRDNVAIIRLAVGRNPYTRR
jgi:transposase InsO family protein